MSNFLVGTLNIYLPAGGVYLSACAWALFLSSVIFGVVASGRLERDEKLGRNAPNARSDRLGSAIVGSIIGLSCRSISNGGICESLRSCHSYWILNDPAALLVPVIQELASSCPMPNHGFALLLCWPACRWIDESRSRGPDLRLALAAG